MTAIKAPPQNPFRAGRSSSFGGLALVPLFPTGFEKKALSEEARYARCPERGYGRGHASVCRRGQCPQKEPHAPVRSRHSLREPLEPDTVMLAGDRVRRETWQQPGVFWALVVVAVLGVAAQLLLPRKVTPIE